MNHITQEEFAEYFHPRIFSCSCGKNYSLPEKQQAQPEPVEQAEIIEALCARIKAADDAAADRDYMLDSDDCIAVIRGTWKAPMMNDKPDKPLAAAKGVQPEPMSPQIVWPKARDVGRYGDMSPSAHLRVGFDSDNDVCVSVWDDNGGASIEFCNGGGGGGRSPRTRLALIALMVAMEVENAATPALDWWAVRSGAAAKGGAL